MTIGEVPLAQLESLAGNDGHPAASHLYNLETGDRIGNAVTGAKRSAHNNEESRLDAYSRSASPACREAFDSPSTSSSPVVVRPSSALLPDTEVQTTSDIKEKGKTIVRGRTMEREARSINPLSVAESRRRDNLAAIEVDVRPVKRRQQNRSRSSTLYSHPSETLPELENHLLEPCPEPELCKNVAEVLSCSDGFKDVLAAGRLGEQRLFQAMARMVCNNGQQIQSTRNSSSFAAQHEHHLKLSAAQRLATEIIQQIYLSLAPTDFNSVRHTCRSWFLSGLHQSTLETMIRRGGWSLSSTSEIAANKALLAKRTAGREWVMSKHISRQCALGPDWTGNGLNEGKVEIDSEHDTHLALIQISTVDFTEVGVHYPGKKTTGSIFTMSSCGKYLMVSNGCLVYVYELNTSPKSAKSEFPGEPGALRPDTSIICPHRVLACSMDTSSSRHAIAVLLEGRMGLVCDITSERSASASGESRLQPEANTSRKPSDCSFKHNNQDVDHFFGAACLDRISFHSSASRASTHPSTEARFVFPGIFTTSPYSPTEEAAWQAIARGEIPHTATLDDEASSSSYFSHARALKLEEQARNQSRTEPSSVGTMPLERGPRSLYRDLCSDDDPPRSVAICPQRRCVAFGCASGIELHWVDALTGQDVNRWFPLTAPSDFLYFLPLRRSVDSAKKLRLISSAARPSERSAIIERAVGVQTRNSPFWERLDLGSDHSEDEEALTANRGNTARVRMSTRTHILDSRANSSDHYRAVPLSDGYHILFTDPATGLLCLGSDAPVGGPTKLLRKIWFQGPDSGIIPICYVGGSDLTQGIRVVAAFGSGAEQSIWFFSVPSDVFEANYGPLVTTSRGPSLFKPNSAEENHNSEWMHWWPDDGLQEWLAQGRDNAAGFLPRSVWPVKIRGQQIGTCPGVVDLAIDAGPRMTIWAISASGVAKAWKLDDGNLNGIAKSWVVARDGTVRHRDVDGDIEMIDSGSSSSSLSTDDDEVPLSPLPPESFDGSASICTSTVYTTSSARFHREKWTGDFTPGQFVRRQAGGDIIMKDGDDVFMKDTDGVDSRNDRVAYHSWLTSHVGLSRSFRHYRAMEEEGTGITRLDIEIR